MDLLISSYASDSEGSDNENEREKEKEDLNDREHKKQRVSINPKDTITIEDNKHKKAQKQKDTALSDLPDLPSFFMNANKSKNNSEYNDPSKHQGRIRQFPHVEGNYATFVYIPINLSSDTHNSLLTIHTKYPNLQPFLPTDDTHISLSRTFPLLLHHIQPFVDSLSKTLKDVRQFDVEFTDYKCFTNDQRTRSFVSLGVGTGSEFICKLIKRVDKIVAEFKGPVFYADPLPHMTFGWLIGDIITGSLLQTTTRTTLASPSVESTQQRVEREKEKREEEDIALVESEVGDEVGNSLPLIPYNGSFGPLKFTVGDVVCKSGKWVYHFALK
eukprot:TRINITY_DN3141_c0_g2_i2.p1 TRINITY_DN3141_c0_g2~~TRINITY_DN3141_c0_g2_i2.p1  ORF type:complete len:329 (-),score=72.09 TRINITY_DN3141_c0_g2_i2:225-1211(-)